MTRPKIVGQRSEADIRKMFADIRPNPDQKQHVFGLKQAAAMSGISDGLLILWIQTGRIKPSQENSFSLPGSTEPALGWDRYLFNDEDIAKLRSMVEQTTVKKSKQPAHVKGAHYTVQELAVEWGLGVDKIRELFEKEPGVIKLAGPASKGKRAYVTLRIPEKVAERVQRRNS